jgi:hypothetical protein
MTRAAMLERIMEFPDNAAAILIAEGFAEGG